jgi:hypothetical protein
MSEAAFIEPLRSTCLNYITAIAFVNKKEGDFLYPFTKLLF